jgi:soluble lytic murein transglycosylase-like protein
MAGFIFGGNSGMSYEQLQRQREVAAALAARGPGSPRNIGEGLSAVGNALAIRGMTKRADEAESELRSQHADTVARALSGGFGGGGRSYTGRNEPVGDLRTESQTIADDAMSAIGKTPYGWNYAVPQDFVNSLVGMESGGNFGAVGPDTRHGNALGFGQVMPANVTAWSKEILGREITPDEFLANPDLQKQIVYGKLDDYWQQTGGNAMDVASLWHSGVPYEDAVAQGRADVNMSTKDYAESVAGGYGGGGVDINALAEVAGSPLSSPGERQVAEILLAQELQRMQPPDPMQALELERAQLEVDALRNPQPGFRMLSDEEEAQMGLPTDGAYQQGKDGRIARIGGGDTNVEVTLPGQPEGLPADEEALRSKLGGKEGEAWAAYLDQGTISSGTMSDMQMLDQLIEMVPSGPVEGRLAAAFTGYSNAADAFQSVVKRVAPTLRATGSGATSDIEYEGMLKSLPQLAARPEANRAISAMMKAKAQINIERADVVARYQNNEISATDARKALRDINSRSIMTPELKAILDATAPTQPSREDAGAPPEGVTAEEWNAMTPEDRALWQN